MSDALGPRVYLVGRILSALLGNRPRASEDQLIEDAVRIADSTLAAMGRSDGKVRSRDIRFDNPNYTRS